MNSPTNNSLSGSPEHRSSVSKVKHSDIYALLGYKALLEEGTNVPQSSYAVVVPHDKSAMAAAAGELAQQIRVLSLAKPGTIVDGKLIDDQATEKDIPTTMDEAAVLLLARRVAEVTPADQFPQFTLPEDAHVAHVYDNE